MTTGVAASSCSPDVAGVVGDRTLGLEEQELRRKRCGWLHRAGVSMSGRNVVGPHAFWDSGPRRRSGREAAFSRSARFRRIARVSGCGFAGVSFADDCDKEANCYKGLRFEIGSHSRATRFNRGSRRVLCFFVKAVAFPGLLPMGYFRSLPPGGRCRDRRWKGTRNVGSGD